MTDSIADVPAGWYDDPEGRGKRYWNGMQWTEDRLPTPEAVPGATSIPIPATMRKRERFRWVRELTPDESEAFDAYLDALPDGSRPVYGFVGLRNSLRKKLLGGGASHMIVLVFPDQLVFSRRGMGSLTKEHGRVIHAANELADVHVTNGPFFSSVRFTFRDGSKTEVSDVHHGSARPIEHFMTEGVSVFERSRLDAAARTGFWQACSHGLPIPDERTAGVSG